MTDKCLTLRDTAVSLLHSTNNRLFTFFLRFNITLKRFFTRNTPPSQYKLFSTLTDNNAIFCIIFLFPQANYK